MLRLAWGIALSVIFGLTLLAFTFAKADAQPMMQTCSDMMNKAPKNVTISSASSQLVKAGHEATMTLLIKDKETNKPLSDARVPVMIERGPSMSTMDMSSMILADLIGQGKYQVKFTPDKKGVYTIHTHVIPEGKSMMSMMNNHMDVGVIAK